MSDADCAWAVDRATLVGVTPEQVLLSWGKVNRIELWDAFCQIWGIPWVDVRAERPNPTLVEAAGIDRVLAAGFIPYRASGSELTVATSRRPSRADEAIALEMVSTVAPDLGTVRWVGCSDLDIDQVLLDACRNDTLWDAADRLTEHHPDQTAATGPARWNYPALWIGLGVLVAFVALRPVSALVTLNIALSLMFVLFTAFKAVAALAGSIALRRKEIVELEALLIRAGEIPGDPQHTRVRARTPDHELPHYTILVPAYREEGVIAKLMDSVGALDYPPEKLDIVVLLEEDDPDTLAAARKAQPPGCVRLLVVPNGAPKTKPRACNVGLRFARGDYLVIFDAEDRPDPAQLRTVLDAFAESDDRTVVVQCRLNYFNSNSNLLTRFFALEYASWFDYMLPGLDALRLPIPLGGTSNHFITSALRDLGGWDAHNVTEDADLGLRATVRGLRVGVADSTTWEEACSRTGAWIKQRTRWIKGYMVTALVHSRHPLTSVRRLGARGTFGLVFLIAGTPLTFLALPLAWATAGACYLASAFWHVGGLPSWAMKVSVVNLSLGYASVIAMSGVAMTKRRAWWLVPFALLNPFYWCLHSIAAWRALWQLFFTPSVWEKTPHGLDEKHHADLDVSRSTEQSRPIAA